jgi:hypothetical protein
MPAGEHHNKINRLESHNIQNSQPWHRSLLVAGQNFPRYGFEILP